MTTEDDELTPVSGWTDEEILRDDVRAAGALYAAATLEELGLIELVERLNELNQEKMLSIGAGEASNLLHEFWDKSYKRMPPKRRAAVFAGVFGATGDDGDGNEDFAGLFAQLVSALADGPPDAVGPAATALHENLASHTDASTSKAAAELRAAIAEIGVALSDMELRTAYSADDMWQLVENVLREWGTTADVEATRARASAGATILRHLAELADGSHPEDGPAVAAARQWVPAADPAAQ